MATEAALVVSPLAIILCITCKHQCCLYDLQTISQRLLVWVDKTVEAEQAAAEKAAAGQASVGAGKGGWKAMTSNHHSFSVIDLYFHLQVGCLFW